MRRGTSLALVAAGVAAASAAASTGAYLVADSTVPPFRLRLRKVPPLTPRRRAGGLFGVLERLHLAHWLAVVIEVVVAAVLVVLAALALWQFLRALARVRRLRLARSRSQVVTTDYDPGEGSDEDAETALRNRVRDELDVLSTELAAGDDPREAVIACYVRMEAALAAAGSPRRPSESPMELLARTLVQQRVPAGATTQLTDLFAEARFSRHAVDDEMRRAAQQSLAAIRDALSVSA